MRAADFGVPLFLRPCWPVAFVIGFHRAVGALELEVARVTGSPDGGDYRLSSTELPWQVHPQSAAMALS